MSGNIPIPVSVDALAVGRSSTSPFITVFETRDPTTNDVNYQIQQRWFNTSTNSEFILTGFSIVASVKTAIWNPISGTEAVETLTGDSGGSVSPDSNQNINTIGTANQITVTGTPGTNTLTWSLTNGTPIRSYVPNSGTNPVVPTSAGVVNMTGVSGMTTVGGTNTLNYYAQTTAKYVVDPTLNVGTHQTITAALAAASSGQTIFIRPGTYTENLTLKAGVNLTAYDCDADSGNVIIIGKCTATYSGTCAISGIYLRTNSDFCLSITGSNPTSVNLTECFIDALNNTAIQMTTTGSGFLTFDDCAANLRTTGIAYFSISGTSNQVAVFGGFWDNVAASTTASTVGGTGNYLLLYQTNFTNSITTSSSGFVQINNSNLSGTYTMAGSATSGFCSNSMIRSSASSCFTITTPCSFQVTDTTLVSSNTNVVTGSGTLVYAGLNFPGSSSLMNVSTMTGKNTNTGGISFDAGNNVLSKYVQAGSFTPSIQFGGGSTGITYTTQIGEYTRIGNLVFVRVLLTMSNKGSSTGAATMAGFPISAANSGEQCFLCVNTTNITYDAGYQYTYLDTAGTPDTIFDFYQGGSGSSAGSIALQDTNFANNARFEFNAVYFADGV